MIIPNCHIFKSITSIYTQKSAIVLTVRSPSKKRAKLTAPRYINEFKPINSTTNIVLDDDERHEYHNFTCSVEPKPPFSGLAFNYSDPSSAPSATCSFTSFSKGTDLSTFRSSIFQSHSTNTNVTLIINESINNKVIELSNPNSFGSS